MPLSFGKAFKYPFNRWQRLFNVLWLLLPIIGWFAVFGYQVRLVQRWVDGNFQQLPKFRFWKNLKRGFMTFVRLIPIFLVLAIIGWLLRTLLGGIGVTLFQVAAIILVPVLVINLYLKQTVAASFDFDKLTPVFEEFGDYVVALIYDFVLRFVFGLLSIILVGIPAALFTQGIFLADFYGRHVK